MSVFRCIAWTAVVVVLGFGLVGCSSGFNFAKGKEMTGGDPYAGKQAITTHDCTSCHVIPGMEGDKAVLGPDLDHWAMRSTIAKKWPNTPDNLEQWIRFSEKLKPDTTMKMLSVNEKDAKDIAAYLYSIQ